MTNIYTIGTISFIVIVAMAVLRDWGEIEIEPKKLRIKRRQSGSLPPVNLDTIAEKSAPSQLPQDD